LHGPEASECTNYVTCISHQMQKHKFDLTSPDALFMEAAQVPVEHEK
jgi:hypothetical protein